jgi:hypothetical protein
MSQPKPELALRYRGGDRHHLFLNHGTWFLRFSVREAPWLKADRRVAFSLGTKDLAQAKERRDAVLAHLHLHAALTADAASDFRAAAKAHGLPATRPPVDGQPANATLGLFVGEGRAA